MEAEYKIKVGESLTLKNTMGLGALFSQRKGSKIVLTSLVYTDESNQSAEVEIKIQNPVEMLDGVFEIGYMSKLNDQRWGANLTVDFTKAEISLQTDLESPITELHFKLIY